VAGLGRGLWVVGLGFLRGGGGGVGLGVCFPLFFFSVVGRFQTVEDFTG